MRLAQELRSPLIPALALMAAALFFGGNLGDSSLPWLGTAAVVLVLGLLATRSPPLGLAALAPLFMLALWCAVSVAWSIEPDRSWSYANRAFIYAVFALVGALLAVPLRSLFYGVSALLGAVCVWALAGKVFPGLYEGYAQNARLSSPIDYWNSLALLGDIALPLGLCLARRHRGIGTLLVSGWIVAIALTYSRGGVLVAVLVVLAWMLLSGAWLDSLTTLVAAGIPAAGTIAVAFALPALTASGQTHSARVRDGLVFGAVLLLDGAIAAALARFPPPDSLPYPLRRVAIAAVVLACAGALVVGGLHARHLWDSFTGSTSTELTNGPSRLGSLGGNFRWSWWVEAWRGFESSPLKGTGAGTFAFTNLRYQTSDNDDALEPHNLPLQFLSETGIVGLVLFATAALTLVVRARRAPGPQLALALALPVYLLHSLIDIDWDFVAVSAPVFLIAGALAVRPSERPRTSPFALMLLGGIGLALVSSLFALWLGNRWTQEAESASTPAGELAFVHRAREVDPLSIEPLLDGADAEAEQATALRPGSARTRALAAELGFYEEATRLQPANAEGWYQLGEFDLQPEPGGRNCPRDALRAFNHATILAGKYPPYADAYAQALAEVNSGRYPC